MTSFKVQRHCCALRRPPQHLEARFQAYEAEKGSETAVRQFHGTLKTCQLGHDPTRLEPCIAPDCATCQIIKGGFKVSKAKPRGMITWEPNDLTRYRIQVNVFLTPSCDVNQTF